MSDKKELAQRLRPQCFADMWGNRELVATLESFVEKEDRPQTYLFYGPAGTGKTTAARAFCHELGINELNISEYNASDKNGVDDIRGIINDLQYSTFGRRAIILDEVHMLSASAQSAALKMLEEPPEDTYFFLCTTDPQKLTQAIKSRCIQCKTELLNDRTMMKCLKKVNVSEEIDTTVDVLDIIVEKAEGTPRFALKLLDKISGLDEETAIAVLNREGNANDVEDPDTRALCQALLNNGWRDVVPILQKMKGTDVERTRRAILGYMTTVLLKSNNGKAAMIMSNFLDNFYDSGFAGLVLACNACFLD